MVQAIRATSTLRINSVCRKLRARSQRYGGVKALLNKYGNILVFGHPLKVFLVSRDFSYKETLEETEKLIFGRSTFG